MSRNYGVQRFTRHPYQPVTWRMRLDDALGNPIVRLAIAAGVVAMILLGMLLSAKADCLPDNNGHTVCGVASSHRTAARHAHKSPRGRAVATSRRHVAPILDANGNGVKVCASGHRHCVSVAASARPTLQCVVDHIEAAGVHITALGGYRAGHCSPRHMHSCSLALDVNQTARDIGGPPRHISSAAASACGAVSGSWWASNPDNGHFQVGGWAGTHGSTITASAHRRHHHRHHHRLARLQ